MKLEKVVTISGQIECKTGLCIKGSNSDLNIGGADSEVIKNPLTGHPYIPGSSIKGKMRSQLEKKYDIKSKKEEKQKRVEQTFKPNIKNNYGKNKFVNYKQEPLDYELLRKIEIMALKEGIEDND